MKLHRVVRHPWPLNAFDAALVAQTYPGRPMTTHHVLEVDVPVNLRTVRRATRMLVVLYPELASVVELGEWPNRFLIPAVSSEVEARIFVDDDGSHAAMERWIRRPISLEQPYPFGIRIAPAVGARQSITLSLHHSVADGRGAMGVFAAFLDLLQGGRPSPRRRPPTLHVAESGTDLGRMFRAARRLRHPCVSLSEPNAQCPPTDEQTHEVSVRTLPWQQWDAFGSCAGAHGVSRYVLLQHAVAAAVREHAGEDDLPVRILSPIDLRSALAVPPGALQNWLGAAEVDIGPELALGSLQAALRSAASPQNALATTSLASGLATHAPASLARAIFRFVDETRHAATHTLMLTRLPVPRGSCWPAQLRPVRLWCTSLLPRNPALGITVTTAGRVVTVAASWQSPSLARETVDWILDRTFADLGRRARDVRPAA